MSFIRRFDETQIQKMLCGENGEKFQKLYADVMNGTVFPAVRRKELHFYYMGGCLFKFTGNRFTRDKNFEKFGVGFEHLPPYEKAKKEIEVKFTNVRGKEKERRLLDELNRYTFRKDYDGKVVVLDIEVNLNGTVGGGKKCDMVLLNRETDELMFVEGKVFSDKRVLVEASYTPEVISQVNIYTSAVAEQRETILEQYAKHVEIINRLFQTSFRPPKKLIEPAKLLVYKTPKQPTRNGVYTVNKINAELGAHNVLWVESAEKPTLDEIWTSLIS